MKHIYLIATVMTLAGVLAIRLSGQTSGAAIQGRTDIPATKIAIIRTEALRDEEHGITRYVNAMKSLKQEFKTRYTPADQTAFKKRYDEVVSPINQDIGKALDQFATQRGITLTLDLMQLQTAIITFNPTMDVTDSFIAEYNSKHPATVP